MISYDSFFDCHSSVWEYFTTLEKSFSSLLCESLVIVVWIRIGDDFKGVKVTDMPFLNGTICSEIQKRGFDTLFLSSSIGRFTSTVYKDGRYTSYTCYPCVLISLSQPVWGGTALGEISKWSFSSSDTLVRSALSSQIATLLIPSFLLR